MAKWGNSDGYVTFLGRQALSYSPYPAKMDSGTSGKEQPEAWVTTQG